MKKNIAYIGHSYHNKTKSTEFLIDYLKEFYNVDVFLDESWLTGEDFDYSVIDEKYYAVVIFQVSATRNTLDNLKCKNIIYFPMYDQVRTWNYKIWYNYQNCKIINFSKTVHEKLLKWGFDSIYLQYFTEPKEFIAGNKNEIFFWQRVDSINFNYVKKLLDDNEYKMHIHSAPDPNNTFDMPAKEDERKYSLTYSQWFDTREEMQKLIEEKQIYVAPRVFEGIGMSFLEAMAMGKAVVANDEPTMNEYIENGVTGYLFSLKKPQKINFSNIETVQKNAWTFHQEGYKKWMEDRIRIIDFINAENVNTDISLLRKIFYTITTSKRKDIIKLKLGRNAYLSLFGFEIIKRKAEL